MDGETAITLGAAGEVDPGGVPAFDGLLETPNRAVVVSTAEKEPVLEMKAHGSHTPVRVWTNHPTEPDRVIVGIDWRVNKSVPVLVIGRRACCRKSTSRVFVRSMELYVFSDRRLKSIADWQAAILRKDFLWRWRLASHSRNCTGYCRSNWAASWLTRFKRGRALFDPTALIAAATRFRQTQAAPKGSKISDRVKRIHLTM
jgi:hypothetical protein